MTRSLRKRDVFRKSSETSDIEVLGTLPALFARQSSQAPSSSQPDASQAKIIPRGGTKLTAAGRIVAERAKSNAPRHDQEIIVISSSSEATHISISSDSPSHISISSDCIPAVPSRQTQQSAAGSLKTGTAVQSTSRTRPLPMPAVSTSAKSQPPFAPIPLSTPLRGRGQSVSRATSLLKRAIELDDDFDQGPILEQYRVPRQVPTTSKGLFLSSTKPTRPSLRSKPLAPKDKALPLPTDSRSSRRPTPPKRARLTSPEHPAPHGLSSGNEADIEELIPSSQSDEQELNPPKFLKKNPSEVKDSVDKWRKEALAHPPSPELSPLSSEGDLVPHDGLPPSDDFPPAFNVADVDVDVSMEAPLIASAVKNGLQSSHSETEVSLQLRGRSSASTLSSIRPAASRSVAASTTLSTPASPERKNLSSPSAPPQHRPITPPPSDHPPLPCTPVALNTESKTAKIIADIKANVYAEAVSSPDEAPFEFKELDDSSENSDDDFMKQLKKVDKGKRKAKKPGPFSSPLSMLDSSRPSRRGASRYNLRHRSPSSSAEEPKLPSLLASHNASKRQPSRKINPLEALLREKKLADKHGNGMDALHSAEAAIASSSKTQETFKFDEDDDDSEDDSAWADEEAAMQIVQLGARGLHLRSSSPLPTQGSDDTDMGGESGSDNEALEEGDCKKILGEENGEAVGKILAIDRRHKAVKKIAKKRERVVGVPFWDGPALNVSPQEGEAMEVDGLPPLPFSQTDAYGHPLLTMLWDAASANDTKRLVNLLSSHILALLEPPQSAMVVPWLFNLATSSADIPLSELAYLCLLHIYDSTPQPRPESGFSFSVLSNVLVRLGAKPKKLEAMGWTPQDTPQATPDLRRRGDVVYRIVALVTAFARRSALPVDDISDVMSSLLLIALDPSTSSQLKRDIMIALECLGQTVTSLDIEATICSKILRFAKELTPINRSLLLSLLVGGCSQMSRIARTIARCLLLEFDLPSASASPLSPIIELLSPVSGSQAFFDIQGNSDKVDYYEDLACNIEILSKALTDIDQYVQLEKENAKEEEATVRSTSSVDTSGKPAVKEKTSMPLEQIKTLLDCLHGKIVDTRAAHLDRSRAKAALQRLSFRVHYQRSASLRSGTGTGKPRNLHGYFGQPRR